MPPKLELWTYEKEGALIDFMESRRFMWDTRDVDFFKAELKRVVYDECAELLGPNYTGTTVKDRWTNIKGTFAANYKKLYPKSEDGAEEVRGRAPTWNLYKRLLFLAPSVKSRPSTSQLLQEVAETDTAVIEMLELSEEQYDGLKKYNRRPSSSSILKSQFEPYGVSRLCKTVHQATPLNKDDQDEQLYSKQSRTDVLDMGVSNQEGVKKTISVVDSFGDGRSFDQFDHYGAVVAHSFRENIRGFDVELAKAEIQNVLVKYHKDNPNKGC